MAPNGIFLIRHGETEWNAEGRFQGQKDSPLTPGGRAQAHRVGRRLAERLTEGTQAELHVSPLGRTRETAQIISALGDYASVRLEPRLQEVTIGSWDGLTHVDIDHGWPGRLDGSTAFRRAGHRGPTRNFVRRPNGARSGRPSPSSVEP